MTDTKPTRAALADKAEKRAAEMVRKAESLAEYAASLRNQDRQDQQDTVMAWTLAKIRQIIGVNEKPTLDQLPDLVRAAVKQEWLPIDDYAKSGVKIIAAYMIGPAEHHEIGCLSWNVEGESWQDHGFQYVTVKPEPTHYMPLQPSPKVTHDQTI